MQKSLLTPDNDVLFYLLWAPHLPTRIHQRLGWHSYYLVLNEGICCAYPYNFHSFKQPGIGVSQLRKGMPLSEMMLR